MQTRAGRTWIAGFLAGTAVGCTWATGLPECPISPFGDASPSLYEAGLSGLCRAEARRWKVETPRARPSDAGPSLLKAEFSSLTSVRLPSLLGALRFDWSGVRGGAAAGQPRSERAVLALGGLLRLHETVSLQTRMGLEHTGVQRSRAAVSSVWQPSKLGVVFAEWVGSEEGTEAHRLGARWWLVPRRLAIDLGARHLPDGAGWAERRVGLAFSLPM